jgi:glutathione S-transferase
MISTLVKLSNVPQLRPGSSQSMSYLNSALSFSASLARLGFGIDIASGARKPEERLVLYDFEACPFCRKAREALSHLGLEVEVRPTGMGSARREGQAGGKVMVPYPIDPNTNKEMYESDDIVQYLYKTYGDGRVSWLHRLGPLNTALSFAASASRVTRGRRVVDGHNPAPAEYLNSITWSPHHIAGRYARLSPNSTFRTFARTLRKAAPRVMS